MKTIEDAQDQIASPDTLESRLSELSTLQLALVGGGSGDVTLV